MQELVKVHELALGATECEVTFTVGLDTCNRVATDNQRGRLISQKPLDSFLFDLEPTFAKLDVEGYEEEILRGGKALLGKGSLQAIELETVTAPVVEMLIAARICTSVLRTLRATPVKGTYRRATMQRPLCQGFFLRN